MLFFVDNIYRYTWPVPKCPRCWVACLPPWATSRRWLEEMGRLQERITSTKVGSITSIQAVYVPAGRLDRPVARHLLRPLGLHRGAVAVTSPRWASTPPWTRSTRPRVS